jgi:oligoribonuclease NrnB/cAMP/cGMP phosphodiesterase (DHH superfamily)
MRDLPKPDVILTHESDLDGFVSGLLLQRLAQKLFDTEVPLQAWNYQGWKTREMRERSAWVSDMTFETRLDRPNWVIVDHHTTDLIPRSAQLIYNSTKSAGSICYELCCEAGLASPVLDRLIHLNNIADLFLAAEPDFALATDYANLVKTYQFWNLHLVIDGKLEALLDHPLLQVMEVKRRVEDPIGYEWSLRNLVELSSSVGYVPTVVGNNNLIIHQMLERRATPYTVLVTLFRKANNAIVVSLRSREGEALRVAEKLQGGGHPNAAGATLPRSIKSIDDAIDYLRSVIGPISSSHGGLNSLDNLLDELSGR